MYIQTIYYKNALLNGEGAFHFHLDQRRIKKWTILPDEKKDLELLQLITISLTGSKFLPHLPDDLKKLCIDSANYFQIEAVISPHPQYKKQNIPSLVGSGVQIYKEGPIKKLSKKDCVMIPPAIPIYDPGCIYGAHAFFMLAYGDQLNSHNQTDDFHFLNPFYRVTRFHSLFHKDALITDPVAFLQRLHQRAVRLSRYPAINTFHSLIKLFKEYCAINTDSWFEKSCNFSHEWHNLDIWQQKALLPIIDATRHILDAFPRSPLPLNMPGLIILHCPHHYCPHDYFPHWLTLLNILLPRMQFIMTHSSCTPSSLSVFHDLQNLSLPLPATRAKPVKKGLPPMRPKTILLIDVDSRLPNIALMKISQYYKGKGYRVILGKRDYLQRGAEAVYASSVFYCKASQERIEKLQRYYGNTLILGGSGIDIHKRLPSEFESMPADYTLYPELKDRAIGFLTRGCPHHCPFCIVPIKEGGIQKADDLDILLKNTYKKLILLDDNILAHKRARDFLQEMVTRDIHVNFNQTLDITLLDRESAQILKQVKASNVRFTRRVYHFSLNTVTNREQVFEKYQLMDFKPHDNVEFICMYGYNTTLAEDVERFSFLRSLPGAYVFVQEYQPLAHTRPPQLNNFFNDDADELKNTASFAQ
ncbi:MAG: hypothetical protein ACMUIP_11690 [bacterium]